MTEKRTSVFENGLIWFGAGVSIAEILTGTYLADLGFGKGLLAIIVGHIIGCTMLFLSGLIGGKVRRSAMETAKMSFGSKGGLLFSALNVIQLVGWTAIMIYDGALAADGILGVGNWVWCLLIGGLIIVWILIGIENLGKVNTVAMAALFILTILLSFVIFGHGGAAVTGGEGMTFGAAVELSVAMPLSWLPLISDYTREAEKPVQATAVSAVVYGLVSCWMYVIGMGARDLYRRVGYRADYGKGRTGDRRPSDHCILHRDHHLPGRVLRRHFQRVPGREDPWKMGSGCGDCDRYCRSHPVPHGRYHGLPVFHRICFCTDDCHSDCGFLYPEKGREQKSL